MRVISTRAGAGLVSMLVLLALGIAAVSASDAGAAGSKRVCGTLPDTGYYNYIKAQNVSCKTAKKVSRKAGRNFCGHHFKNCSVDPGETKKGHTSAKGWSCDMKIGYEFYRAECRRGNQKFVNESAA